MEQRKKDISNLGSFLLIIFLLNYIGTFVFERFDLTSEKRHSLSEATKTMLRDLDDVIFVKVYLEGDFEPDVKRLRDATKEKLDEMKAYGGSNIQYEFINPTGSPDEKTNAQVEQQLYDQGMRPTDVHDVTSDGTSDKTIWPWAVFSRGGMKLPVPLLKSTVGMNPNAMINVSIENLEYEMASAVKVLNTEKPRKIAFLEGNGELDRLAVGDISMSLSQYYAIDRISINQQLSALTERVVDSNSSVIQNKYDLLIVAKPDSAFSDKDLFIIDQYIMYGGKVLWLVDPVFASMDSLQGKDVTMAIKQETGLEEKMLFYYGVRPNPNLVMDLQCAKLKLVAGMIGNQPKYVFKDWYYFPLMNPDTLHPISKGLNYVKGEFTSTLDTVGRAPIRKTILLRTSQYTRLANVPSRIGFSILRYEPNVAQFNVQYAPTAVLLEGRFPSPFGNHHISSQISEAREIAFRDTSEATSMIVVADGDIIKNWVQRSTGEILPLGYDKNTKQTFGNRDFLMNCVNYLCGDIGLMEVRAKKFKIRLMDTKKVDTERIYWQAFNITVPIVIIVLLGLIQFFVRKQKFAK